MSDEYDDAIRADRVERAPAPAPRRFDDGDRPRRRDDDEPRPSGSSGLKTVIIVIVCVAIIGFCVIGGGVGLLIYGLTASVKKVRESAQRMQTSNNYKQIALAMHNYHDAHGHLPPVAMPTKDGKPGLSWRVALLPYLEQDHLYRQFKLDKGWEDPDNRRLAAQMPIVYAPRQGIGGDMTHVRLFVGPKAIFDPAVPKRTFGQIAAADGTATTLLIVEATDPTLWIRPDELPFDRSRPLPGLGLPDNDYFIVSFADGAVRPVKKTTSAEKIKLMIDFQDGQFVDLDK